MFRKSSCTYVNMRICTSLSLRAASYLSEILMKRGYDTFGGIFGRSPSTLCSAGGGAEQISGQLPTSVGRVTVKAGYSWLGRTNRLHCAFSVAPGRDYVEARR